MNGMDIAQRIAEREINRIGGGRAAMTGPKVHWAVSYRAYGETRTRSLCNRSSSTVINTKTIESGQNVTNNLEAVTCSFCRGMIERRPAIAKAKAE